MAAAEKPAAKGQAWFCTTGLPSDVVIEVGDMSFHLHKFPLMDKSSKLHRLITEQEEGATRRRRRRERRNREEIEMKAEEEEEEEGEGEITEKAKAEEEIDEDDRDGEDEDEDELQHVVSLPNFPGGAESFEAAAKFCYGVKLDLTAWNVALLRCAGEYLEMTEDVCEDNLISRTDRFLAQFVLRSLKESIKTLKSCEDLLPLADDLGIVQRCVDMIAAHAASNSLFSWPMNDGRGSAGSGRILWNGIDTGVRRRSGMRSASGDVFEVTENAGGADWLEDLATLSLPMYKRVIAALKEKDLNADTIERALLSYAKRSIPGLSRAARRRYASAPVASEAEQRELLETVITNLPQEGTRHRPLATIGAVATTKFLLGLLRTANILRASEASVRALERKIGSQLELATLDDLLIPSYSYLAETLYDVDCVERILAHFLADSFDDGGPAIVAVGGSEDDDGAAAAASTAAMARVDSLKTVGKLLDGYLAEIASDANLKADKFCGLAKALPDDARVYHDGLYRAVDIYLKTHPRTTEAEREKVCGVMDCRKLTLEACTHAAQNERLPLRAVVQVLFFEQLQLRRAIAGTLLAAGAGAEATEGDAHSARAAPSAARGTWRTAVRENQVLRLDIDSMRNRVQELERECSDMKKALGRLDGGAAAGAEGSGGGRMQRWSKLGCRFSTQVCDSHERNVVQSRTSRLELSP